MNLKIIGFLITVLVFYHINKKLALWFVILVLLGILVLNSGQVATMLSKIS